MQVVQTVVGRELRWGEEMQESGREQSSQSRMQIHWLLVGIRDVPRNSPGTFHRMYGMTGAVD